MELLASNCGHRAPRTRPGGPPRGTIKGRDEVKLLEVERGRRGAHCLYLVYASSGWCSGSQATTKSNPRQPALGADVAAPGRPSANQSSETELANDVRVRSVLDQPDGCPALVEATDRTFAGEQLPEALFID